MKNIADLKRDVREKHTMDSIIKAVIFKAQQRTFPKNQAFLQNTFFQLKEKVPGLLNDFVFDESGVTPFSDELDSVIFRLETSSILSTSNPTYNRYTITVETSLLEDAYNRLHERREEVDKCASLFSEIVMSQGHLHE